jgi:hypothetical protein
MIYNGNTVTNRIKFAPTSFATLIVFGLTERLFFMTRYL